MLRFKAQPDNQHDVKYMCLDSQLNQTISVMSNIYYVLRFTDLLNSQWSVKYMCLSRQSVECQIYVLTVINFSLFLWLRVKVFALTCVYSIDTCVMPLVVLGLLGHRW